MNGLALTRLLQLASPALPVGAFSYSQGLEWAAESGRVCDEPSAGEWIADVLRLSVGSFEAPLLVQVMAAARSADGQRLAELNAKFKASREASELRNETLQMGHSLRVLTNSLKDIPPAVHGALHDLDAPGFPVVWACIAAAWRIPEQEAVTAYLWAWVENQVMAAVKIVPLGQTAGQRLLVGLGVNVAQVAAESLTREERDWCNFAPGFALASCQHETQYTRLFRS